MVYPFVEIWNGSNRESFNRQTKGGFKRKTLSREKQILIKLIGQPMMVITGCYDTCHGVSLEEITCTYLRSWLSGVK